MRVKPNSEQAAAIAVDKDLAYGALCSLSGTSPVVSDLFSMPLQSEGDVKRLYIDTLPPGFNEPHTLIATGLKASDALVRIVDVKLSKEKDIEAVIEFQAEPHLPFSSEDALIDWIKKEEREEGSSLLIFACQREKMQTHLDFWSRQNLDPELVTCPQAALSTFGKYTLPTEHSYALLHFGLQETTVLLMDSGRLAASQTAFIGTEAKEEKLVQECQRMLLALTKKSGLEINKAAFTGFNREASFFERMATALKKEALHPQIPHSPISAHELACYALPIGAAFSALTNCTGTQINFRKKQFTHPNPWLRYLQPLKRYAALAIAAAFCFYLFGQAYLGYRKDEVRVAYAELLEETRTPNALVESTVSLQEMTMLELEEHVDVVKKRIESIPELYPLRPNVPLLADFLAWLHTLPPIQSPKEGEEIKLESLNYSLVKYPEPNKKTEKYQARVELELSAESPEKAREVFDLLNTTNRFVDTKNEVKWTSGRGKYRATFFLRSSTPGEGS